MVKVLRKFVCLNDKKFLTEDNSSPHMIFSIQSHRPVVVTVWVAEECCVNS